MEFKELTDEQWMYVEPFLPPPARNGRPRADDRATVNGVIYVLTTGCRWMDMPSKYGSYKTVWRRLKMWKEKDVWKRLLNRLYLLSRDSSTHHKLYNQPYLYWQSLNLPNSYVVSIFS